jgi:hypothetical protein
VDLVRVLAVFSDLDLARPIVAFAVLKHPVIPGRNDANGNPAGMSQNVALEGPAPVIDFVLTAVSHQALSDADVE